MCNLVRENISILVHGERDRRSEEEGEDHEDRRRDLQGEAAGDGGGRARRLPGGLRAAGIGTSEEARDSGPAAAARRGAEAREDLFSSGNA